MDEKQFLSIIKVFGSQLYELKIGFATMFNLCVDHGLFERLEFLDEKDRVESFPDLKKLRKFLDGLQDPKGPVDLEKLLRDFEGPVQ